MMNVDPETREIWFFRAFWKIRLQLGTPTGRKSLNRPSGSAHLDPNNAETHFGLGGVLISLGRYEEAESEYREALRSGPNQARVYFGLGLLLMVLRRKEEAGEQFLEAMRSDPEMDRSGEKKIVRTSTWVTQIQ